jgi:hypothetical protein
LPLGEGGRVLIFVCEVVLLGVGDKRLFGLQIPVAALIVTDPNPPQLPASPQARKSRFDVEEDDPLSAVNELRRMWTMSREAWQIRIETQMRLSCNRDVFLLQGSSLSGAGLR